MERTLYENCLIILKNELMVALGCTEPIAIAYAAARAREALEDTPIRCTVRCSGNIVKNVMGVTVPNSGGLRGIEVAAVLGVVGGDAQRELQVLESVTADDIERAKALLSAGFCTCELVEGVENLYVEVLLNGADGHTASAEVRDRHNNVTRVTRDGAALFARESAQAQPRSAGDKSLLSVESILEFADEVSFADIEEVIGRQVEYNTAISNEGLSGVYGAQAGRVLLGTGQPADPRTRAKAAAAAGSDARMSGCPLPVVINSGSGNQGITITMPLVEYAKAYNISRERLFRALAAANLIAIHQKKYIGSLSAYCGAVSAACGAGAGIAYMLGGSYELVSRTITNTIATIGGMVCDGAKSSCAAKIASAVECALFAYELAKEGHVFQPGEGMVKSTVEETIKSIGRMGRVGMHETDIEILNIMLGK